MPHTPDDLTVIIPAKIRSDQELEWLSQAIQSVYAQKGVKPFILVGNDHSPIDPVLKRVKLTNLRWLNLPDGLTGLAACRNYLMSQVTTKYFFPLDADDLLPPEALSIALKEYPGDGFLYGSTIMFNQDSHTLYAAQPYDFSKLLTQVYWPSGALQLTENWAKIKWDETLPAYEDWDYWIRSGEVGICGHAISSVLYWYRRNPQGIISKLLADPAAKQKAVDRIREKHSKLYQGGTIMCCGRNSNVTYSPVNSQSKLSSLPGAEGFVTLEYKGTNSGDMHWYGPVTGTAYKAGGHTCLVSVDVRDAMMGNSKHPGLLDLSDHGKPVFVEYAPPAQVAPQVEQVKESPDTTSPVAPVEVPQDVPQVLPQEAQAAPKPSGLGKNKAAAK